jgi:hypothetical protein
MSSTACDDQLKHAPPEDLEQQCRDARVKAKEICVWKWDKYQESHFSGCGKKSWCSSDWIVCPYCAKPIEIKK